MKMNNYLMLEFKLQLLLKVLGVAHDITTDSN